MPLTETRITLEGIVCIGCDCGVCISQAVKEIGLLPGVSHVRVDRLRSEMVIRHDSRDAVAEDFSKVMSAAGIEASG